MPIWLLDIDGVLNAPQSIGLDGYVRVHTRFGAVNYRPALVRRITDIHDAGAVEIRWLTTWMKRAEDLAVAVGLPLGLPVDGARWFHGKNWWKALSARDTAERNPGRFIIWTDDDLDYSYGLGELDWVIGRPMLRISPDPALGLTDADMAVIAQACGVDSLAVATTRSDVSGTVR